MRSRTLNNMACMVREVAVLEVGTWVLWVGQRARSESAATGGCAADRAVQGCKMISCLEWRKKCCVECCRCFLVSLKGEGPGSFIGKDCFSMCVLICVVFAGLRVMRMHFDARLGL